MGRCGMLICPTRCATPSKPCPVAPQAGEVKSRPFPTAVPGARPGDYRPPEEALSFRSRAKVKQVRRLQAFCRRLSKHRLHQAAPPRAASRPFCEKSAAAGVLHLPASEVSALRHVPSPRLKATPRAFHNGCCRSLILRSSMMWPCR